MPKRITLSLSRKELYDEIWANSLSKTAKKYDVPYAKLRAVCIEYQIPLPSNSYWGKISTGVPVSKTPLPTLENDAVYLTYRETIMARKNSGVTYDAPMSNSPESTNSTSINTTCYKYQVDESASLSLLAQQLPFLSKEETAKLYHAIQSIEIKKNGQRLHAKVIEYKDTVSKWNTHHKRDLLSSWRTDRYYHAPEGEPVFWKQTSPDIQSRLYRFLDALYRTIEHLGGKVADDFCLQVRGEYVSFKLIESQEQVRHEITKEEQKKLDQYEREKLRSSYAYSPNIRKYDYRANGKLRFDLANGTFFRDTDQVPIEDRLDEIIIALYIKSEAEKKSRLAREEQARKAEEEKKRRMHLTEQYNLEVDKVNAMLNEVEDFSLACKIRQYIAALQQHELTPEGKTWIEWAKQKADWFDPTISAKDPLLGERHHEDDASQKKLSHRYFW